MEQKGMDNLVLLDGRVTDPETNRDMTAGVGIADGKIATIEPERLAGKEVIDAAGLVIAPGFIDSHMHGQTIPSMRSIWRSSARSREYLASGWPGPH